jgi:hypothetical protein
MGAVAVAGCLVGCGGGGSTAAGPAAGQGKGIDGSTGTAPAKDGCDGVPLAPPAAGEGVQVSIDVELAAGEERQVCKLVLVDQKVNMNYSEGLFTKGSHHALVWQTAYTDALPTQNNKGATVDAAQVVDCEGPFDDWSVRGVIAGGRAVGVPDTANFSKGTLPADVAFKIEANSVLALNFHMFNASGAPVHACYKANLNGIPDAQVKSEAGTIFYYNPFVTVPAKGTSSATMACPVSQDVTVAAGVSHMHRRGMGYSATLLDGDPVSGGKEIQALYATTEWEEPVVKAYAPGLSLKQGQWIKWTCDYTNTESREVAQGQQTTDEMCMFIGQYWPRSLPMDSCSGGTGGRNLGTGTKDGAQTAECWNASTQVVSGGGPTSAAARYAAQRCITDACPNVSARFYDWRKGTVDLTTIKCN